MRRNDERRICEVDVFFMDLQLRIYMSMPVGSLKPETRNYQNQINYDSEGGYVEYGFGEG